MLLNEINDIENFKTALTRVNSNSYDLYLKKVSPEKHLNLTYLSRESTFYTSATGGEAYQSNAKVNKRKGVAKRYIPKEEASSTQIQIKANKINTIKELGEVHSFKNIINFFNSSCLKKTTQNGVASLSFKSSDSRSNDLNHILSGGKYSYMKVEDREGKVNKSTFSNISYFNNKHPSDKKPKNCAKPDFDNKTKTKAKSPNYAKKTSNIYFNSNSNDNASTYDLTLNSDGNISKGENEKSSKSNQAVSGKSSENENNEKYENSVLDIFCCICSWKFPYELSQNEINVHINQCIDGKGEENRKNHLLNLKRLYEESVSSSKGVVRKTYGSKIKI